VAAKSSAPAPQEKRLTAYIDWLAQAVDMRTANSLCGITVPACCWTENAECRADGSTSGSDHVQRMHESLHHFVASRPERCRYVKASAEFRPAGDCRSRETVTAWIVDETSYVKKGTHSVGVARQYWVVRKKETARWR